MQISNTRPEIPLPAERAAHFHRLHDTHVQEVDGEPVDVLSPQLMCDWLIRYKDDGILFGVIHDINANAGIAVNIANLRAGKTAPADLLIDNREPAGGPVPVPLSDIANLMLHHEKHKQPQHRDLLVSFLAEVGLEPNLPRLRAELCPTCGK
jgi:hypothetical protein